MKSALRLSLTVACATASTVTTADPGEFAPIVPQAGRGGWEVPGPQLARSSPPPPPPKRKSAQGPSGKAKRAQKKGNKVVAFQESLCKVSPGEFSSWGPFVGGDEPQPDMTPWGALSLGRFVYKVAHSSVFFATIPSGGGRKVPTAVEVKYGSDCVERLAGVDSPRHPLAREWNMQAYLDTLNVTEPVLFLSPPATLVDGASVPDHVASAFASIKGCRASGAQIRLSIRQPAGVRVAEFFSAKSKKRFGAQKMEWLVLEVLRQSLWSLELMHSAKVVHGALRVDSLRVIGDPIVGSVASVQFVDLEDSFFLDERPAMPGPAVDVLDATVRELAGDVYGPRDDALRMFEVVADLLSNGAYRKALKAALESATVKPAAALEFKSGNMFLPHGVGETEACRHLPAAKRRSIQGRLEAAVTGLIDLDDTEPVDFARLREIVTEAQNVLSDAGRRKSRPPALS